MSELSPMKMTNSHILNDIRLISCISILLLSVNLPAAEDNPTAQQLINNMTRATHELNYDGIFIYKRGRQMDSMRLIHKTGNNGETERLVSLTGHPREVIRNRNSVTCYFPDNKAVMVEKSQSYQLLSTQLPEPIEKVARYYRFSYVGPDRIAGRHARVVTIQPNDNYRYGYQLWIDNASHLLLKSELKNASGYPLEQIVFTKLDVLDAIPDELLEPSISGEGYTWYTNSMEIPADRPVYYWKVKWMPEGFTMRNHQIQAIVTSDSPVDHFVYTDGMAMVSVFIEKLKSRAQFIPGPSKVGAVNAFARLANGYQVTAVGEVPQATVQKMAISVVTE